LSTNTPDPASASSANPDLPSVGFEETDQIRAAASTAEEEFLLQTFGISIPRGNIINTLTGYHTELAQQIAQRVVQVIDSTRSAIALGDVRALLETNINSALQRINLQDEAGALSRLTDTAHARRVRAVCESLRESLPAAVINDVVRYGLPVVIAEGRNIPPHIMQLNCDIDGGMKTVRVDTRHIFWRESVFAGPAALENALRQQGSLSRVGISVVGNPPLPEDYRLNDTDISNLLHATSAIVDLNRRYDVLQMRSGNTELTIDVAKLLRYRTREGRGPLVAAFTNPNQLRNLLMRDVVAQQFVTCIPNNTAMSFGIAQGIANRVFAGIQNAPGAPLAVEHNTLFEVQSRIAEQHRFFEQLREGTDNHWGAAMATMMLMKHKDLRDVLSLGDEAQVRTNLAQEQSRKSLLEAMTQARSISYNPSFAWDIAENVRTGYNAALTNIRAGVVATLGGESYPAPTTPAEQQLANTWARNRKAEADQVVQQSANVAQALERIVRFMNLLDPTLTTGYRIFDAIGVTPGTPPIFTRNPGNFNNTLNINVLLDEVQAGDSFQLRSVEHHQNRITELRQQQQRIASREMPRGADAQQRVMSAELIRYQGLTQEEARRGANVLRARGLLDTDMAQVAQRISGDLYRSEQRPGFIRETANIGETLIRGDFLGSRDTTMMRNVARECHVPLSTTQQPLWSQTRRYDDLITAYHALRKLKSRKFYDANSDVPWSLRLREGARVDLAMQEITRTLVMQHAKGILEMYGPSVGITEQQQARIIAEPSKAEHERILRKCLETDADVSTAQRVSKVIEEAGKQTQSVRRFLGSTLFGKDFGEITGSKNPVSFKSLLYGNKTWSAKGIATNTAKGVATATKFAWARKWGVAAGAGIGFLALGPAAPLGMVAGGLLGGKFLFKPKN